jgi:hypothetical protein
MHVKRLRLRASHGGHPGATARARNLADRGAIALWVTVDHSGQDAGGCRSGASRGKGGSRTMRTKRRRGITDITRSERRRQRFTSKFESRSGSPYLPCRLSTTPTTYSTIKIYGEIRLRHAELQPLELQFLVSLFFPRIHVGRQETVDLNEG